MLSTKIKAKIVKAKMLSCRSQHQRAIERSKTICSFLLNLIVTAPWFAAAWPGPNLAPTHSLRAQISHYWINKPIWQRSAHSIAPINATNVSEQTFRNSSYFFLCLLFVCFFKFFGDTKLLIGANAKQIHADYGRRAIAETVDLVIFSLRGTVQNRRQDVFTRGVLRLCRGGLDIENLIKSPMIYSV